MDDLTLQRWVITTGGEYFFSPSIATIKTLAEPASFGAPRSDERSFVERGSPRPGNEGFGRGGLLLRVNSALG
jgi:hypothetical protein